MNKLLIISLFLFSTLSFAFTPPSLNRPVTDTTGKVTATDKTNIEASIRELYQDGKGSQIAVLVVDSLEGNSVEEVAEQVFNTWGLGDKEKDNGVLLLVAINDRKMRIEVGYGLEGTLTDYQSSEIITAMKPYFKGGQFGQGIFEGVNQIKAVIQKQNPADTAYLAESKEFDTVPNETSVPYNEPEVITNSPIEETQPHFTNEQVTNFGFTIVMVILFGSSIYFFKEWRTAKKETLDIATAIEAIQKDKGSNIVVLISEAREVKEKLEKELAEKRRENSSALREYEKTNHYKLSHLKRTYSSNQSTLNSIKGDISENESIISRGAY